MASVLFCNIGVIRDVLQEDNGDQQKVDDDKARFVDHSFTDSSLWPYKSFRSTRVHSKQHHFVDSNINYEIVSRAIEYSDFLGTDSESQWQMLGRWINMYEPFKL